MPASRKKQVFPPIDVDLQNTIEFLKKAQLELRERHQQMRALHEKTRVAWRRYRNLFEAAPIGYVITDARGRIMECNRMAAEMLGDPGLMQGQPFWNFVALPERFEFRERFDGCRHGRQPRFETRLLRSLKDSFPVQLALARSRDADSEMTDIRITLVDLSELKAVQAALERAKAHVEEQVEKRTRELQRSNEALAAEVARRTHVERQLLEITERERRRFGQDLHDETCQALTGLALEFAAFAGRLEKEGVQTPPNFRHLAHSLSALVENSRAIARGLHPVCLSGGLLAALEELTKDASRKVPCTFKGSLPGLKLPPEVELSLYRIAQEALNNTAKHANASTAAVRLWRNARSLHLTIEDDGEGLPEDTKRRRKGMGLDILNYRARSIGAEVMVANRPKGGVKVSCDLAFSTLPPHAVMEEGEKSRPGSGKANRRSK
jgi:PAS domain S-box-containing protein